MAKEDSSRRLGGTLDFDPNREKYIVDKINELSGSGQLSKYLQTLIRLAFETPEAVGRTDKLVNEVIALGGTPCAREFFSNGNKEIAEMHRKIDEIYNMCLQMYTLCQFGKVTGLEKKVENTAKAEFMLERQVDRLCDTLGIRDMRLFESCKIASVESKSADVLEFIINHYDGIVNEIKAEHTPVTITIPQISQVNTVVEAASNNGVTTKQTDKESVPDNSDNSVENTSEETDDNDTAIDFGDVFKKNANMSALKFMFDE